MLRVSVFDPCHRLAAVYSCFPHAVAVFPATTSRTQRLLLRCNFYGSATRFLACPEVSFIRVGEEYGFFFLSFELELMGVERCKDEIRAVSRLCRSAPAGRGRQ